LKAADGEAKKARQLVMSVQKGSSYITQVKGEEEYEGEGQLGM